MGGIAPWRGPSTNCRGSLDHKRRRDIFYGITFHLIWCHSSDTKISYTLPSFLRDISSTSLLPEQWEECHSTNTLTASSPSADFRLMRTLMALSKSGLERKKGRVRAAATESLSLGNAGMARVSLQVPLLPQASLVGLILFPFSHFYRKHSHLSCQSPKSGFVVDRKSEHITRVQSSGLL